jgi:transposase
VKYYIGLDAHSKTSTFVVLDSNGQVVSSSTVGTTETSILDEVRCLQGSKALVLEVCTLSKWLYALLRDEVDELIICDPGKAHRKNGPKNDYADAERLAQLLRGGFCKAVYHEESFFYDLRKLVNTYRKLVWDIARIKNRYKALFRSEAIDVTGGRVYSDPKRIQKLSGKIDQFVAGHLFELLEELQEQKKQFQAEFKRLEKKHSLIRHLSTVPGISTIRACIIAAAVCSAERFEDKHHFWSYSMLVRHAIESGGKVYGRKQIRARADLKDAFLGAAESIIKNRSPLIDFYEESKKKGQHHREARKGLARKVASICLRIMRTNQPFKEEWSSKIEGKPKREAS